MTAPPWPRRFLCAVLAGAALGGTGRVAAPRPAYADDPPAAKKVATPRKADPAPTPPPPAPDAPYLTLPAEVKADPGSLILVDVATNAAKVKTLTRPPFRLLPQYAPGEKVPYAYLAVIRDPGTYTLTAVAVANGEPLVAQCDIVVGTPTPPVPPGPVPPGPVPPGPTPPQPPDPFGNGTGARGPPAFRVFICYDPKTLAILPPAQETILYAQSVRDYLDAHCVKGPDGKKGEWRIWPAGVDSAAESALWQKVSKRPEASLPWIVIGNGTTGFEGPLPKDTEATLELLKKYGG